MKKINIKTIYKADKHSIRTKLKSHCVFLHNEISIYFTDIKDAKSFLVKTNDFLNDKLWELNEISIELYSHFKRSWFYLGHSEESSIRTSIRMIDENMKLIISRSSWENGPPYTWKWMDGIMNDQLSIAEVINELNKRRGNYAEIRVINTLIARILFVKKQMEKYPEAV